MTKRTLSRRQGRWADEVLSNFNFFIRYRSGAQNVVADTLTRQGGPPRNNTDERTLLPEELVLRTVITRSKEKRQSVPTSEPGPKRDRTPFWLSLAQKLDLNQCRLHRKTSLYRR